MRCLSGRWVANAVGDCVVSPQDLVARAEGAANAAGRSGGTDELAAAPTRGWFVAFPMAAPRLPRPSLLGAAWLASAVRALMLQLPDGIRRLTTSTEYLAGLPAMGNDPLGRLHGFTRHLQEDPTHAKGRSRC